MAPAISPITADGSTIDYRCDSDPVTGLADFSNLGRQPAPGPCLLRAKPHGSLQIAHCAAAKTLMLAMARTIFLELNTVQCSGAVTTDCEIDSTRTFSGGVKGEPAESLEDVSWRGG